MYGEGISKVGEVGRSWREGRCIVEKSGRLVLVGQPATRPRSRKRKSVPQGKPRRGADRVEQAIRENSGPDRREASSALRKPTTTMTMPSAAVSLILSDVLGCHCSVDQPVTTCRRPVFFCLGNVLERLLGRQFAGSRAPSASSGSKSSETGRHAQPSEWIEAAVATSVSSFSPEQIGAPSETVLVRASSHTA